MPLNRGLVVMGGSAGSVEAIMSLAAGLPSDLPAAVLVVVHTAPHGAGELAGLVDRAGRLPCHAAVDGEAIRLGHIYMARPDFHLLVEAGEPGKPGLLQVTRGPLEKRHRPAVDPLFRSAAAAFGSAVIGVILSGNLDDGSAGLALVKKQGGLAVVQDPEDALYPGMPRNALLRVKADHVVPLREMAGLLAGLCRQEAAPAPAPGDISGSGEAPDDGVSPAPVAGAAIPP